MHCLPSNAYLVQDHQLNVFLYTLQHLALEILEIYKIADILFSHVKVLISYKIETTGKYNDL